MFGSGKKQSNADVRAGEAFAGGQAASPNVSAFHTTTIPSKFLPKSGGHDGSSLAKRVAVWVLGGAAVSGLLILGASLLVRGIRNQEVVRVQTNINIPREQTANVNSQPQPEPPLLVEQAIGLCAFSVSTVGKDQVVPLGSYQTKAHTATYFCPAGSVTVQLFQFPDPVSLEERIRGLSERYLSFLDVYVQNVNDKSKIVWGSDQTLLQVSVTSLDAGDSNVRGVLDEYARMFVPNTNLPWPLVDKSQPQTPEERDQKRVSDIKKIQIALEFYKIDHGVYPVALDQTMDRQLVNYLPQVPVNPSPGGSSYRYLQALGGQSYELRFILEIGAVGYPQGELIARPQGIVPADQSGETMLPSSSDIDADGLTDVEEQLWGTSPTVFDSDADTFADGEEVRNAYDPTQPGKKLETSLLVKNYLSSRDGFTVLYPGRWSVEERANQATMFSSESKEDFFQVLVEGIAETMTLFDWYKTQFPESDERAINTTVISGTYYAILSPDGLTAYARSGKKLFTISYTPGIKEHLDYQATFAMFLKTIKFFENPS